MRRIISGRRASGQLRLCVLAWDAKCFEQHGCGVHAVERYERHARRVNRGNFTAKRFHSKAQDRREAAHPGNSSLCDRLRRRRYTIVTLDRKRLCNSFGVTDHVLNLNPGCAASAATLGFGVKRLRRSQSPNTPVTCAQPY